MRTFRFSNARDLLQRLVARLRRPNKRRRTKDNSFANVGEVWAVPLSPVIIDLPPVPDDVDVRCLKCNMIFPIEDVRSASCGHLFCKGCLKNYLRKQNFICASVSCLERGCNSTFSDEQVREIVGQESYRLKQLSVDEDSAKAAQKALDASVARSLHKRRHFHCQLCLEEVAKEDSVELYCGHWHCQDCLHALLKLKISEGEVAESDLACPIPGCAQPLSEIQIQAITGQTALWERFLEFRARNWKPQSWEGCMATCPSPDCESFEVQQGVLFVNCPRCRKSFCMKCSGTSHVGMSCEEYQAWKLEQDADERAFENLMKREAWRRCPKCGMPSERESGCNFMRCPSASCKNRTKWCYLCGKELTNLDHLLHYPEGPFRSRCFGC